MSASVGLVSAGLIEKDDRGDVLWVWSYPSVSRENQHLYTRKSGLEGNHHIPFVYGQYMLQWYYIMTVENEDSISGVNLFSFVLTTKDFNPEKYEALCSILIEKYTKSNNLASMLELYLSVVTKGSCSDQQGGQFAVTDFDQKQSFIVGSLKDVINTFGIETILLYTAILLKKRVLVYQSRLSDLLYFVRVLPAFAWHRKNWNILHPYVSLFLEEIEQLKSNTTYIAGCTDRRLESRTDLYDIWVDVPEAQITVSPDAKDGLAMGKLHKDLATFIVSCAQDEDKEDQQVIKDIAIKTREMLNNLRSLATEDGSGQLKVSLDKLHQRKMPPATENFLYNLAAAEGLAMI